MGITFKESNTLDENEVEFLYEDANWTSYTKDMPRLMNAIKSSLMCFLQAKNADLCKAEYRGLQLDMEPLRA